MSAATTPDLMFIGDDGSRILDVEVKARKAPSDSWAAELRAGLQEQGVFRAPLQAVVTRDKVFIWDSSRINGSTDGVLYSVDTAALIGEITDSAHISLESITEEPLVLAFGEWLARLAIARDISLAEIADSDIVSRIANLALAGMVHYGDAAA